MGRSGATIEQLTGAAYGAMAGWEILRVAEGAPVSEDEDTDIDGWLAALTDRELEVILGHLLA